jgi:hypothetical protein
VAVRHRRPAPPAAGSPAVAAGHVGGGRRLVEEDQPIRVEVGLSLEPRLPCCPYVLPVLLGRVRRLFLRVIAWRAKKRAKPLVPVRTSRSASASRNSDRKMSGRSS